MSLTGDEPAVDDDMYEYNVDQTERSRQTIPSEPMESLEGMSHFEQISSRLVDENHLKHVGFIQE